MLVVDSSREVDLREISGQILPVRMACGNYRGVKSIILCKSLNVVISSGHHAHYTCKNVRALFSQFSWKSINIEPIKRSAEAMFG